MKQNNQFSDSDFESMKWLFDFSQDWMTNKQAATESALQFLLSQKEPRIMKIPREWLGTDMSQKEHLVTISVVLNVLAEKFNLLLAMNDKYSKNDHVILTKIRNQIMQFSSELKMVIQEVGIDDKGVLEEEQEPWMDEKEIQKKIDEILDSYSAGKITQEQMKNRMKEFASARMRDIGKYGGNLIGSLGLVSQEEKIRTAMAKIKWDNH